MQRKKFEDNVARNIVKPYLDQQSQPGYGIIMAYDQERNEASVLMAKQGSDSPGDVHHHVPCPVQLGIQSMQPEKGRQCWVAYKNNDKQFPVITHFYNYYYNVSDHERQQNAVAPLPSFIYGL